MEQSNLVNPREKISKMLQHKAKLTDIEVKDLEVGIYNWTIEYSNENKIIKNWKNPKFYKLYIEKARSVLDNVDSSSYINNVNLLERIKDKEFLPHEIPFMKPESLFPDRWKDTLDAYMKKYKNAYEKQDVVVSSLFKCFKCGKKECTFYSMQTRSADEGETVFVRCTICGNTWKMS